MDFFHVGFLMDAALSSRPPLEVLDGIRDIDFSAVNVGFLKAFIRQLSGRANKWTALLVFLVARLLADHHDLDFWLLRFVPGFQSPKNSLRGIDKEVITLTVLDRFLQNG
ncbi:MAG TPA: hypothetical protein VKX41_14390 [Alloacidobacterium sp.]|nr:hypothetical protein [Alloacidobacterium sp.]